MQEAGLSQAVAGSVWAFGEVEFDEVRWSLRVRGAPVALEPKPLRILSMLLRRAGEVVTRDDLLAELWPGTPVVDKAVTNAVGKLRQALGPQASACIATVPKLGYRLTAEVQRVLPVLPVSPASPVSAASAAPEPPAEPALQAPVALPAEMPAGRLQRWGAWLQRRERAWRMSVAASSLLVALGMCGALAWQARQAQAEALAERHHAHAMQLRLVGALAQAGLVDDARRELQALRARLAAAREPLFEPLVAELALQVANAPARGADALAGSLRDSSLQAAR